MNERISTGVETYLGDTICEIELCYIQEGILLDSE